MSPNNPKIHTHTDSIKDSLSEDAELDKINLDYDYNTEYGDGDIPDVDKPAKSQAEKEHTT